MFIYSSSFWVSPRPCLLIKYLSIQSLWPELLSWWSTITGLRQSLKPCSANTVEVLEPNNLHTKQKTEPFEGEYSNHSRELTSPFGIFVENILFEQYLVCFSLPTESMPVLTKTCLSFLVLENHSGEQLANQVLHFLNNIFNHHYFLPRQPGAPRALVP